MRKYSSYPIKLVFLSVISKCLVFFKCQHGQFGCITRRFWVFCCLPSLVDTKFNLFFYNCLVNIRAIAYKFYMLVVLSLV